MYVIIPLGKPRQLDIEYPVQRRADAPFFERCTFLSETVIRIGRLDIVYTPKDFLERRKRDEAYAKARGLSYP